MIEDVNGKLYEEGRLLLAGCIVLDQVEQAADSPFESVRVLMLYRLDHHHWETPGGKVNRNDCVRPEHCTLDDKARAAIRELREEIGDELQFDKPEYFGVADFEIPPPPEVRMARAYKFITWARGGSPKVQQLDTFLGWKYLSFYELETERLSPDFGYFLPQLELHVQQLIENDYFQR